MKFSNLLLALLCSTLLATTCYGHAGDSSLLNSADLAKASSLQIKVEPEFWWAGMHNPQLQLMIYADGVSLDSVNIQGQGIELSSTSTTDNPDYIFINLDIGHAKAQTFTVKFTSQMNREREFSYQLKPRSQDSAKRRGFSNKDVIYLITPDRFVNGDSGNDNHNSMLERVERSNKDGRHGGDIKGIIESLDYLSSLGVTQLWINPLTENNQANYSYHGYSVTDHYRIDPRYGTNQDYVTLSKLAADKGIGIIKDVVVNHIGSNHWWMNDLPSKDWVNLKPAPEAAGTDTSIEPSTKTSTKTSTQASAQGQISGSGIDSNSISFTSHYRTTVQDPYSVKSDKDDFVNGWFVESMPDLNQTQPLLATYLIQNSIWWIEFANLSGIREDTYSYADKQFLTQWVDAILDEYPDFNIVGEEWSANPITVSYWQRGKSNSDGYRSSLPSLMDFPLYETLIGALNEPEGWGSGLITLYEFLANDLVYADPTALVLFEGNHDTNRLYSLLGDDLALTQMAMAYVLTSNRVPQLFYGTEILMTSPSKDRNDGLVRADFPGGWQGDLVSAFDASTLSKDQLAMKQFTQTLIKFRKTSHAIHSGGLRHYAPQDGIYVQVRCDTKSCSDGAKLMTIYNKNSHSIELDLTPFADLLNVNLTGKNVITSEEVKLNEPLRLDSKGVTMLDIIH